MFTSNLIKLRNEAGLSQVDVAKRLGMARATYIALETGKSSPNLNQIKALAELFEVAPAALVSEEVLQMPEPGKKIVLESKLEEIKPREIVQEEPEKLREVLLYVLDKVGAKPNIGETVLYKLLYFIDFDYYEKTGKSITGLRYLRNHYGPTPTNTFSGVVDAMKGNQELEVIATKFFNHRQKKYLPVVKPDLTFLSADELRHIDEELARLSDKTASELTSLSHRDMPWLATKDGQPIDYQLAMYRTTETAVKEPEDEL